MFQKRLECRQYTVMLGLLNLSDELLGEDIKNMDLTLIKERMMNKVLNFNNHVRQIWLWAEQQNDGEFKCNFTQKLNEFFCKNKFESSKNHEQSNTNCQTIPEPVEGTKKGTVSRGRSILFTRLKNLNRNEFFVYSTSLSFNPEVKCVADLINPTNGGGIVLTITAKMPMEDKQRKLYLQILLSYMGKHCVLLEVKSQNSPTIDSILSNTNLVREDVPLESSTVLKPIPKYFDEDYSDEENNENKCSKDPNEGCTYSFFRHSSYLLTKYANSKLVPREDDKYVTQRLLQVKLQRKLNN